MQGDKIFGVFLPTATGGWIVSTSIPPIDGSFELNREVAIMADRYGFDFILSMMKWRGFGGASHHWDAVLESMMLMSALSQVTERVKVWATVHTILHNPAVIAKMIATLDQVSGGRAGMNIVSGAYKNEFEQMGAWREDLDHGQRYDLAEEWIQAVTRLWQEEKVDFAGEHFRLTDCMSEPKPVSRPRPDLICAGTSEVGLRYTAKYTDAAFVHGATDEVLGENARRAKEIGREYGKDIKTFCMMTIIPGATDEEAEQRVELYRSGVDPEAITTMKGGYAPKPDGKESALTVRSQDAFMASVIAGSPETIIRRIDTMLTEAKLDGMMIIFPDFIGDLKVFGEQILPALRASQRERA